VAAWSYAFAQEGLGRGTMEEARTLAARRIPQGDIFLWDDQGPASMAIRARPTPHVYTVTGVYTPPELRGRGYASACVSALSQLLLDSGKQFCSLFTDLSNPVSNSIYRKIGYEPVCDFTEFRFERESEK
jgi:predicted GNAT family acetyltransferase